jgi:rRNA-processing protein FCF1
MAPHRSRNNRQMIAILDSNALLIPFNFKVDVFGELMKLGYLPATIPPVINELKDLNKKRLKGSKLAIELSCRCEMLEAATGKSVDEILINTARKYKAAIVTNDKELQSKLRQNNIPIIQLRQLKYLEVDIE